MQKVGRNDPCPCGSGKKYKKCCEVQTKGKKFQAEVIAPSVQAQQTKDTARVSSLFFKKASAPKPENPPSE